MRNMWLAGGVRRLVAAVAALVASGCMMSDVEDQGTKVLMIGNNFSITLLQHLPQVASASGVNLDLVSLHIGGCSLRQHWENVLRDGEKGFRPYTFGRNRFGKITTGQANVCDVLRMAKWDIVTIQQASHESWKPETFETYGAKMVAKIRELAPRAKIYVQETWSYTPWDRRLSQWGIDQKEMYARLHAAYADFAKAHDLGVIPFGTAVQEWRRRLPVKYAANSFGGDVVGGGRQDPRDQFRCNARGEWEPNCDVFHLGARGEYFHSLVWMKALFDEVDISDISYRPDCVTESEARLMREIAMEVSASAD